MDIIFAEGNPGPHASLGSKEDRDKDDKDV